jgi:pimeloyl-ACP methyl ester carboxylesterase
VFDALCPLGVPGRLRRGHDGIAGVVHGCIRVGSRAVPRGVAFLGAAISARTVLATAPTRSASPLGRASVAVVNGLWGDTVAARYPALSVPMTLRRGDRDIAPTADGLAAAYPDASPRLVLLVHGLCETDQSWCRPDGAHHQPDYGSRLAADLGLTPLFLRYNSGLRVSDNGRRLAGLIESVVAAWPVEVEEVVLVGHSMGGLVAHSACHHGETAGQRWVRRVGHVVSLGSPHLGAPLEKCVNLAASLMGVLPETRPVARLVNLRSVGVKDLRFGARVEADWRGHDSDELLRDRCTEVPLLADASYRYVAASVTRDPRNPLTVLLGDLMVRVPSASGHGRTRRIGFDPANGVHVGRVTHRGLLNHPVVYEHLHRWFSGQHCLATSGRS